MKRLKKMIQKEASKMQLVYAQEHFPGGSWTKSIFLAGPTPRDNNTESWRKEAIKILEELNYDGVVFIPEDRSGIYNGNYDAQVEWETACLNRVDCIVFWIPRDLKTMPAFTTNVEFGEWFKSGKVVLGFPKDAPKNTYLETRFNELELQASYTLKETLSKALDFIGEGAYREGGETFVPAYVWNTPMFKSWYKAQKEVGNELKWAKINYIFSMPKAKKVFFWVLHVHVYIKAEDRIKENEFVVARTDICSIVMYKKAEKLEDTEIVLVKEFRSPASNSEAMIYELPGGSSIKPEENIDVIHDEIKEELGLDIDKDKIVYCESRQLMGTLSSHKSHLYSMELTDEEINDIKSRIGEVHGVIEDTEMTYTEVFTLKEIFSKDLLDWSNIGMIMRILMN